VLNRYCEEVFEFISETSFLSKISLFCFYIKFTSLCLFICCIIVHKQYKVVCMMGERAEIDRLLLDFKAASLGLLDAWNEKQGDEILNSDKSVEKYPFDKSFEEVVEGIVKWVGCVVYDSE